MVQGVNRGNGNLGKDKPISNRMFEEQTTQKQRYELTDRLGEDLEKINAYRSLITVVTACSPTIPMFARQ